MQIWPAIDLRDGKCVRLRQGDYRQETVYSDDPVAVARRFQAEGASHLHIVDLDGARDGAPTNVETVRQIVEAVDMECELGGGIRERATIETLLNATGLDRLVLGTSALKEGDWFRKMCEQFPRQLVLGIDARDGMVATDGWLETSEMPALELANQFRGLPLAAIAYTDISADGMLAGPNLAAMAHMRTHIELPVIASGGVTTVENVRLLAEAGMAGAIIGRALYEGTITLPEALSAADDSNRARSTKPVS